MTSSKSVLIIDDEPDIREIAKLSLTLTKQWNVFTAASGIEGVTIAADQHPDAILLDVMMPEVDGLTTLKNLKTHPETQNIPVILLTATTKLAMQSEYFQWGAQGVLIKPFDPGILGGQIETALGWQSLESAQ
ncbi:MAG: response regulator [Leptolyngbya sp. SIO1D8]|nr:response regulator [Leptolyngbya sp. SIO1D8]